MTPAEAIDRLNNWRTIFPAGVVDIIGLVQEQARAIESQKGLIAAMAMVAEKQKQEIERLKIREHRLVEYMTDVKNFSITMREIANNAIEEGQ